jgi:hypothetical protein
MSTEPSIGDVVLVAADRACRALHRYVDVRDPTMAAVCRRVVALLLEHPHRPVDDLRWRMVAERCAILSSANIGAPLFDAIAHAEVLAGLYIRDAAKRLARRSTTRMEATTP